MKIIRFIIYPLLFSFIGCQSSQYTLPETTLHIKGFSFTGPSYTIDAKEIDTLQKVGSSWVALMPYAYAKSTSPSLVDHHTHQWWGESYKGIKTCIKWSHEANLKVMLKPHLWLTDGKFNGDLHFSSSQDWKKWEDDYSRYILKYAALADSLQVELFCIGVELKRFVKERPYYWFSLIKKVRACYKGQITYAANWDNYMSVPFWKSLDFIGIDAYFSASSDETPTVDELIKGWKPHKQQVETCALKNNKPVIFTEYGFRSTPQCCHQPWVHHTKSTVNYRCQINAFKAFHKTFEKEAWFAGGFIWKWFASKHLHEENKTGYSPQDKPAMKSLVDYFKDFKK